MAYDLGTHFTRAVHRLHGLSDDIFWDATGVSPCYANYGNHPRNEATMIVARQSQAKQIVADLKNVHAECRGAITAAE